MFIKPEIRNVKFSFLISFIHSKINVVLAITKDIIFDNKSRAKLQTGINKCVDAVSITLGPRGRNVVLERLHDVPQAILKLKRPVRNSA